MGCVNCVRRDLIYDETVAADKSTLRILFLGPGESGKSTIMHQIREINGTSHDLARHK